jgi:cell division protein FtsZ
VPQIKPEVETFARIRVVGVGGSGKNATNHMINSKVKGSDFVAVNTDAQDLHHSLAKKKIHIGKNLTQGLGTGMNPEMGRKAIEETKEEVQEALKGAEMVFIACGLGGGTGSGAAPVVARIAKEAGALTVAEEALEALRREVDAIIVIPNDRLLANISKETTAKSAFGMCDDVLKSAVEGISDLITTPGIINIDFADIKSVMKGAGSALMGIGVASGENRATEAAKLAISSPLLDISINGAKGVLFSIAGGDDLGMYEIQDAAKTITESVDPDARIIFGTIRDENLKKGEVKITIIASGFPEGQLPNVRRGASSADEGQSRIVNRVQAPAEVPAAPTPTQQVERASETRSVDADAKAPSEGADEDEWSAVPAFLRRSKLK